MSRFVVKNRQIGVTHLTHGDNILEHNYNQFNTSLVM